MSAIEQARIVPRTGRIIFAPSSNVISATAAQPQTINLTITLPTPEFVVNAPTEGVPLCQSVIQTDSQIILSLNNLAAGSGIIVSQQNGVIIIASATGDSTFLPLAGVVLPDSPLNLPPGTLWNNGGVICVT